MSQRRLSIFGSTGSIGTSTLALVDAAPERFTIECLVAGGNYSLLAEQALKYRPRVVGLRDETGLAALQTALAGSGIELVSGQRDCDALARIPVDIVIAGITGLAGLGSVMAAVEAGQTLALANKESMVSAGRIVMQAARENGARILPLDSEHNAIFQVREFCHSTVNITPFFNAGPGGNRTIPSLECQQVTDCRKSAIYV